MSTIGSITSHIDVAQLVLYAFWIFFFGLILYLNRESRREGYPLHSEVNGEILGDDRSPNMMAPKLFKTHTGFERAAPDYVPDSDETVDAASIPVHPWPGAPIEPATGNPLTSGIGAGAYANRRDEPEMTWDNQDKMLPMRKLPDFKIADGSTDIRGWTVVGSDYEKAGTIADMWIDQEEQLIRYLEVTCEDGGGNVLLPMPLAAVNHMMFSADAFLSSNPSELRHVMAESMTAEQFKDIPKTKNPDRITLLEEDIISAYCAAGQLYNTEKWQRG